MNLSLLDHFRSFAHYNAWANERLYAACARLPEAEYKKPRKAFFKTIHNTLNHLLLVDRLYTSRIESRPHGLKSLDQELYADFTSLAAARRTEDAKIIALMEGLAAARLEERVHYRTITGEGERSNLAAHILGTLFNHQTHHRGQVHDMLSQTEVAPPPLDYIYYINDLEAAGRNQATR